MSLPRTLRFGIQSLDKLIGATKIGRIEQYGIDLARPQPQNGTKASRRRREPMTSSICLAGPDGMGKSVFSLHLASQYLADCLSGINNGGKDNYSVPRVLYVSTDLSYKMALKGWKDFALDTPLNRREPLLEIKQGQSVRTGTPIKIELTQYLPSENSESEKSLVNYLEIPHCQFSSDAIVAEVCFVDLASRTAGDDWGFLHRLLSLLGDPGDEQSRHLVVVDAVEGFETLVGDLNAFGEESSRRSRIAQVMRLVAAKSHLLMVVEEARSERFPEEFVTDVVIRLRNVDTGRYLRRTVEVEKSRGQFHIRGQHSFVIRNGKGSTTGTQNNADDPKVYKYNSTEDYQSYVHVFPSINYLSREKMMETYNPREVSTDDKFAAFGIPYLDNMLGGTGPNASSRNGYDTRGLPCGSATALIGDSLTQKGQLGKAFLSRAFYQYAQSLRKIATAADIEIDRTIKRVAARDYSAKGQANKLEQHVNSLIASLRQDTSQSGRYHPVTILFTTQDLNHEQLTDEFYQWLRDEVTFFASTDTNQAGGEQKKESNNGSALRFHKLAKCLTSFAGAFKKYVDQRRTYERFKNSNFYKLHKEQLKELLLNDAFETELKTYIREHTICRRFEIHDLPAPVLMNILRRNIETAQRLMFGLTQDGGALPRTRQVFRNSQRIRVLIDDLNGLRNAYPEMRDDPLMLPALLFMLRREGVTSLIVDTQASGSPELSISERFESSVRELIQHRIYIWRLPFYGENRVAISVIPPISHEYQGLIRELRWETKDENKTDRALTVDPHFELYMGLEKGQPRPVPLEVRLYAETPSVENYIATEERLLKEIFAAVPMKTDQSRVIVKAEAADYEALRDASHLQRGTRLDHTTILQVNEFWWLRRPQQQRAVGFRSQWNYLNSVTATLKGDYYHSEPVVDPFCVFQLPPDNKENSTAENHFAEAPPNRNRANEIRRLEFFDKECGYELTKVAKETQQSIDRVPYTWDFGFLLCNGGAWEQAFKLPIGKHSTGKNKTVEDLWNSFHKATKDSIQNVKRSKNSTTSGVVSWRDFLAASKIVAECQSYLTSAPTTAFDFTMLIPESFSCLILEMWLSESYHSLGEYKRGNKDKKIREELQRRKTILQRVGERQWHLDTNDPISMLGGLAGDKGKSLEHILKARHESRDIHFQSFSLELYKVWLLLTEAINFEELVDSSSHLNFEFKSRDVSPQAVSARHWYKTASKFIDSLRPEQLEDNWVPVRLPGHFSVRADWFLAVGGGSRSSRLADHALDLLSSRRSNVTRLQEGIGLPTRRLFDVNDNVSRLRTRLVAAPKAGEPLTNVEYDLLRQIGAGAKSKGEDFHWLWRSRIWAYNRHSRVWHKWLNRALLWWHSWHQRYRSNWKTGFYVYDLLTEIEFGDNRNFKNRLDELKELKLDSWNKFQELRDILIAELEQVSISTV